MKLTLPDLTPDQTYAVQFRLKNGSAVSPWSNVIRFQTESDATPPALVTGLALAVSGSSFLATWNDVTTNQDGTPLKDFKDYEVTVTAGGVSKRYFVVAPRFDITLDVNRGAFGTPKPSISVKVRARDLSGNMVLIGATASATNPVPPAPTNPQATAFDGSILVKWTGVVADDFKEYQIWRTIDHVTWTKVWAGAATSAYIDTTVYAANYFKVRTVDVFDQFAESTETSATPLSQFTSDTTAPDTPTGLTLTNGSALVGSTWNYYINADWADSTATDFSYYEYRHRPTGQAEWFYGTATDSVVRIGGLAGGVTYEFQVRAIDLSGNRSTWAISSKATVADTAGPNKPAVPSVTGDTQSFMITHGLKDSSGVTLSDDTAFLEVYTGDTGFTPSAANYLGEIAVAPPSVNVLAGGKFARPATAATGSTATIYVRVIAVDRNGNKSPASDQVAVTLNLIQSQNIADATIGDAKILDLAADKLKANSAFVNALNVQSKLTVKVGGSIESSNFSVANRTGYRIEDSLLTMYDGTIAAKAIELQESSANLVAAGYAEFDYAPRFYTQGVGLFRDITTAFTADQDATQGKFGLKSLKVVSGDAVVKKVFLGPAANVYNINVEPNTDYILSAYVKAAQADAAGAFMLGTVTSLGQSFGAATTVNGQWTRVSWKFNTGTAQALAIVFRFAGVGTWNFDGVQLETKLGKLDTPSHFTLPGLTTLDGSGITTGSISSSQLSPSGDTTLPAWSINLQGNAILNDALVRGKLIVGGSGYTVAQQGAMAIQSYNYSAGVAGWAIFGDGSVEFSNGVFRGTLRTGSAGRRIIVGAAGAVGRIDFYGATDLDRAYIRSWTETYGDGYEAIQIGVNDPETGGVTGGGSLTNRININETGYFTYRGKNHEFVFDESFTVYSTKADGTSTSRLTMTATDLNYFDGAGKSRVQVAASSMVLRDATATARFQIDPTVVAIRDANSTVRIQADASNVILRDSASKNRLVIDSDSLDYFDTASGQRLAIDTGFAYWDANGTNRLQISSAGSVLRTTNVNAYLDIGSSNGYTILASAANAYREFFDNGEVRFRYVSGKIHFQALGGPNHSPSISLYTGAGYGAKFQCVQDSTRGVWFEAQQWDSSAWVGIRAGAFEVNSDMRSKNSIVEADASEMLDQVRATKVKRYKRNKPEDDPSRDVEEIGLIAQEAPEQIVNKDASGGSMGVEVYQMATTIWGAVQTLADTVDALKDEVEKMKQQNVSRDKIDPPNKKG